MSLANHSNIKSSSLELDKNSYQNNKFALKAAHHAAARVAPIWPLDKTVAVNPWWQWRDQPIQQVAAHLTNLANVQLLMPKAYYRDFWQKSLLAQHLQQAAQEQGVNVSTDALVDYLNQDELNQDGLNHKDNVDIWKNLTDWLDEHGAQNHKAAAYKMPWRDEVTQQISQSCGMFFSYAERLNDSDRSTASFYQFWRQLITQDAGVPILMGEPRLKEFFQNLSNDPETVISCFYAAIKTVSAKNSDSFGQNDSDGKSFNEKGLDEKSLDEKSVDEKSFASGFEAYCTALLMDINGWAAVFAQRNESPSISSESIQMSGCVSLLAVRLAWEWAIWWLLESDDQSKHASSIQPSQSATSQNQTVQISFISQFKQQKKNEGDTYQQQQLLWVWHRALEVSVQQQFESKLLSSHSQKNNQQASAKLSLQAVFCIDVRSEPIRRALEAQSPDIQTLGFAGFFGLAIAYDPVGVPIHRPQLPALLSPNLYAKPVLSQSSQQNLLSPLLRNYASANASAQASANFGWVETRGWFEGLRMLSQSFGFGHKKNPQECFAHVEGWQLWDSNKQLAPEDIATLLAGVLGHMGLTRDFASRVLLVAHGSATANNAMTAGLDCGACGGQSGEVNVRVLAYFLNMLTVREALQDLGINIPSDTQFIACLHNTTTDDIQCFKAPNDHKQLQNEQWQTWLIQASNDARAARATVMGITAKGESSLQRAFKKLSHDWAQLRPEWGLNNNAAFIVAPRLATRGLNLEGRAFLHDYTWQNDTDFATLELIMTAPMIVTHWINFQYYASVTDSLHYGSGNKLLHNVVGGNLGVFEGNGGDLRIGLPMQSVHDGKDWRHQPVRLNVYLSAPRDAIATIVAKHPDIKALIDNQWLYLFQWDVEQNLPQNQQSQSQQDSVQNDMQSSQQKQISRYFQGQWLPVASSSQNLVLNNPAQEHVA